MPLLLRCRFKKYIKPLVHYQNLFRLLINGKKRKGAIQIFIETIFKAQENQRFSILTKLKLRALKT